MRIGVNCGHTVSGTIGCGTVGYIDESVETRNVGYAIERLLRKAGHTVVDCTNDRASTVTENLREICKTANAQPLDLFVSIHFNSGGGYGSEVYTYKGERSRSASAVCESLSELGYRDRGIKSANLYVINHTNAPAMLIEVCFADSKTDTDRYMKLGSECIARAICEAITGNGTAEGDLKGELTMTQYEELKEEINALKRENSDLRMKTGYYNYIDKNMPESYKPTIEKLVKTGRLNGNENGELMLTADMMRILTVLDRVGVFD